ncbi:MAG: hypothetical protein ACTHZX_10630 [Microbacterium sp.]
MPSPPTPPAYRVPWRVVRHDPRHPVIQNAGADDVETVRGFVGDRHGNARTDPWGRLRPGDAIELCLCGAHLPSTIVTLAWYRSRAIQEEYLWRFVL